TPMVSLGKAIDRLIRARLPLSESTLCDLVEIAAQRADFSIARLVAQLEHAAAAHAIGPELDLAIGRLIARVAWDKDMTARLGAVVAPVEDLSKKRADPRERDLIAGCTDEAGRTVYADWLEERGDHRC